jgi:hypothetical protein
LLRSRSCLLAVLLLVLGFSPPAWATHIGGSCNASAPLADPVTGSGPVCSFTVQCPVSASGSCQWIFALSANGVGSVEGHLSADFPNLGGYEMSNCQALFTCSTTPVYMGFGSPRSALITCRGNGAAASISINCSAVPSNDA